MRRLSWGKATLVALGLVLAGCVTTFIVATGRSAGQSVIVLPTPSGPYAIGRRGYHWIDEARMDEFDASSKRELMVWIWYPADRSPAAGSSAYLPGAWGKRAARVESFNMRLRGGGPWAFLTRDPTPPASIEAIQIDARDSLPVAGGRDKFPVLLFSPGLGNMPT